MTGTLLRMVAWDVRVQMRENVYFFTVLSTAAFAVVILLLPDNPPDTVVTGILFLDPAIVGTSFVGAIVLMEREQNTLAALSVSPVPTSEYVLAKVITLTGLTFAGGMALVAVAYHPLSWERGLRFILAMGFTGSLGVLAGLLVIATANSMNHFIARLFPISVLLFLPFIAHFGLVEGVWSWVLFGINPGHTMLLALRWAADPAAIAPAAAIHAFTYMGALIVTFFVWALRLHGGGIDRAKD
jgi:fluoroquinolone transport system permease protein